MLGENVTEVPGWVVDSAGAVSSVGADVLVEDPIVLEDGEVPLVESAAAPDSEPARHPKFCNCEGEKSGAQSNFNSGLLESASMADGLSGRGPRGCQGLSKVGLVGESVRLAPISIAV